MENGKVDELFGMRTPSKESIKDIIYSHPAKKQVYEKFVELSLKNPEEYADAGEKFIEFLMKNPGISKIKWDKVRKTFIDNDPPSSPSMAIAESNKEKIRKIIKEELDELFGIGKNNTWPKPNVYISSYGAANEPSKEISPEQGKRNAQVVSQFMKDMEKIETISKEAQRLNKEKEIYPEKSAKIDKQINKYKNFILQFEDNFRKEFGYEFSDLMKRAGKEMQK